MKTGSLMRLSITVSLNFIENQQIPISLFCIKNSPICSIPQLLTKEPKDIQYRMKIPFFMQ